MRIFKYLLTIVILLAFILVIILFFVIENNKKRETFKRTYGGNAVDKGYSVKNTSDGGFVIAGYTESFSSYGSDMWIIKVDVNSKMEWNKVFGGNKLDKAYSIQETDDNGYIVVGNTNSFGAGDFDLLLLKLDKNGKYEWNKTFGGNGVDGGYSINKTSDGGFIISGYRENGAGITDLLLIKTDGKGEKQWEKSFGGKEYDTGYYAKETNDGGFIAVGYTESFSVGGFDVWLIKTDKYGNKEWDKIFGGKDWDKGYSVQETNDGGFIVTGYTSSDSITYTDLKDDKLLATNNVGYSDVWLIKTDNLGEMEWNKTFGGKDYDYCRSIKETENGDFIFVGFTQSFGEGEYDLWLIKTNRDGKVKFTKTFGDISRDRGHDIQLTKDGGFIITGFTESFGEGNGDVWFIKTDKFGNVY